MSVAFLPLKGVAQYCSDKENQYSQALFSVDADDAYQFGLKLQKLIKAQDSGALSRLFGNIRGSHELVHGPKITEFQRKPMSDFINKEWRDAILAEKPECRPVGYRGWMLAHGKLWYQYTNDEWIIIAMNSWEMPAQINRNEKWLIDGNPIHPGCFFVEWFSSDNYESLIDGKNCTTAEIGKCLGAKDGVSLDTVVYDQKFSIDPIECTSVLEARALKNNLVSAHDNTEYHGSTDYTVAATIPTQQCRRLAPYIPYSCLDLRLIRLVGSSGGSLTKVDVVIYALYFNNSTNKIMLFPLVNFESINDGLNYIDDLGMMSP